jgi:hypothetical protein
MSTTAKSFTTKSFTRRVSLALGTGLFLTVGFASAGMATLKQVESEPAETETTEAEESGTTEESVETAVEDVRFTCEYVNGQYTVMYHPQSQPGQSYAWATPTDLGGGWTAERRCGEISRRLESYRPDGLQELSTGVENEYDIVCVTTEQNPSCRIVFTVPPGQDPVATRDRVFENLAVADSGQQTDGVVTLTDEQGNLLDELGNILDLDLPGGISGGGSGRSSSGGINLRPFLDRADGGTGEQLRGNGRQLNPDLFR